MNESYYEAISPHIRKLEERGLSYFHSGGGTMHFFYKGFLINSETENGDFENDLRKSTHYEKMYFGTYDETTHENIYFYNTLEGGIDFIDKYNLKGLEEF